MSVKVAFRGTEAAAGAAVRPAWAEVDWARSQRELALTLVSSSRARISFGHLHALLDEHLGNLPVTFDEQSASAPVP